MRITERREELICLSKIFAPAFDVQENGRVQKECAGGLNAVDGYGEDRALSAQHLPPDTLVAQRALAAEPDVGVPGAWSVFPGPDHAFR